MDRVWCQRAATRRARLKMQNKRLDSVGVYCSRIMERMSTYLSSLFIALPNQPTPLFDVGTSCRAILTKGG